MMLPAADGDRLMLLWGMEQGDDRLTAIGTEGTCSQRFAIPELTKAWSVETGACADPPGAIRAYLIPGLAAISADNNLLEGKA